MYLRFLASLIFLYLTSALTAQSCSFQVELSDTFGDGWNGGELTVRVNGVATSYTLTEQDGGRASFFFTVNDGEPIELDYDGGPFATENAFRLLDNADVVLYDNGLNGPTGDNIFTTVAACAACAAPPANSITLRRVRFNSVDLQFRQLPAAQQPLYRILYRAGDFDPEVDEDGLELTTTDTLVRVGNLTADTMYTFFVGAICRASDDTSGLRGPFVIETQKRIDVGVTQLISPVSDCELSGEEVTIGITNFGGEAQAFFNVDFSIDGEPAGVSRPADGIFTGVVGVDSTEEFTFDTRANLQTPGLYELKLWTELEDDEVQENDTLTVTVRSVGTITDFPYVENFEDSDGGWFTTRAGLSPSSWAWGEPTAGLIGRAPEGRNAWVTNPNGNHFNQENSSLVSPCMDFSGLEEDPFFSAQLFVDTEVDQDFLVIETSVDGAEWTRIETGPTTINWYNDRANQLFEGDGGLGGFATVAAILPGAAGASRYQLRFRFVSDFSVVNEGVLVDAVRILPRQNRDLAAAQAGTTNLLPCGSASDTVTFRVSNLGLTTESGFEVNYQVGNGDVITETFTENLFGGSSALYTFATTFDGSTVTETEIRAWVSLPEDGFISNDTTVFFLSKSQPLPFIATFSNGIVPRGWEVNAPVRVGDRTGEGNPSLFSNLFEFQPRMTFTTANYGPVMTGDSLSFTVRQNELGGSEPAFVDTSIVRVAIIADCGDTTFFADIALTGDTIVRLPLEEFDGSSVRVLFDFLWRSGDFINYVDDISIFRCPADLGLTADITDETSAGNNGAVTIIPTDGLGPYEYEWTVAANGATAIGLSAADYTVTVTDAVGCTDVIRVTVDFNTDVDEADAALQGLRVYPNPTSGLLTLELDAPRATSLRYDLFDLTGRRLLSRDLGRQQSLREGIDLGSYPTGTYLLRIQSERGAQTVRLVKQ